LSSLVAKERPTSTSCSPRSGTTRPEATRTGTRRVEPCPGRLDGIVLAASDAPAGSALEYCDLRFAGGYRFGSMGRAATIVSETAEVYLRHDTIERGAGDGVLLGLEPGRRIEDTVFRENAGAAVFAWNADSTRALVVRTTAEGNGINGLVAGGTLTQRPSGTGVSPTCSTDPSRYRRASR